MAILWFFLGLVLLILAAGCFGMARGSFTSAGEGVVGLVLGFSLSFATFFLLIIFTGLDVVTAGSMIFLAILGGWFEVELGRMFFQIKAHGLKSKAPVK